MKTIALWSGPRNVSTALMYSFANRKDMEVIDEPLFGCFLKHTGVWRPSREEALKCMNTNYSEVFDQMKRPTKKPYLFTKNMANHLVDQDLGVLMNFKNIILTRKPASVINSYIKQVEEPSLLDLAYKQQAEILEYLNTHSEPCLVVDSDALKTHPEKMLTQICDYLSIPFSTEMLSWPAGPLPQDGVWAKYWYHSVHKSTGFSPSISKTDIEIPERLNDLLDSCNQYYQQLTQ